MEGARVVVVGASSGVGRAFGEAAAAAGADVVLAARRAIDAGAGRSVQADVCDPAGRAAVVDAAVEHLGGIDLLFFAAGRADVGWLADVDPESWRTTFETNVVALNQLLRVALPHLAPAAVVAVVSSETSAAPRTGLAVYAATKAALDASLRGWRQEHPQLRFSTLSLGPTMPTEFGAAFDGPTLGELLADWDRRGLLAQEHMATAELASVLVALYGAALANPSVGVEHLVLRHPSVRG